MVAKFQVGPYDVVIQGDAPRQYDSPRSVHLQVDEHVVASVDAKLVVSVQLKPSEARAVASALLSAATESR